MPDTAEASIAQRETRYYALHLHGGGVDIACSRCLTEARIERANELVSVARCDPGGDTCGWCGR